MKVSKLCKPYSSSIGVDPDPEVSPINDDEALKSCCKLEEMLPSETK